jgi:transposase
MLSKGDFMEIRAQLERGVYKKDIAKALGVDPRTVRRGLVRGGAPAVRRSGVRASKLDGYKSEVDGLIKEGVWNAVVILRILKERGYTGSYTILRDYMQPMRPLRAGLPTVRFETPPGRQMQTDWGEVWTVVGGRRTQVQFIANELGWSRRFHFWSTDSQDAEHTYEGLIRGFEYLGGVPVEVLIDNQKTAVVSHRAGERVVYNDGFLDLAGHYGFTPRACKPGRAQTKGKDERMVGYIKGNFFKRYRSFESLEHINALAERWLREEADLRLHGTVKEVVLERFERERSHLGALPAVRFDTSYRERRTVAWDGYIDVRGNRYSVPTRLCGTAVAIRVSIDGLLRVYDGQDEKAAEHRLRPAADGWSTVPDHHAALWRETLRVERRALSVYEEAARCNW